MIEENKRLVTITLLSNEDEKGNAKFNVRWYDKLGEWRNRIYTNTNLAWMMAYWNGKAREVVVKKLVTTERQQHGSKTNRSGIHGKRDKIPTGRVQRGGGKERGSPDSGARAKQPARSKRDQSPKGDNSDRVRAKGSVRKHPPENAKRPSNNSGDKRLEQGMLC